MLLQWEVSKLVELVVVALWKPEIVMMVQVVFVALDSGSSKQLTIQTLLAG